MFTSLTYSQNEKLKVIYEVKVNYDEFENNDPSVKSRIEAINNQIETLDFVLKVDGKKSIFKINERMVSDNNTALNGAIVSVSGQYSYFKDADIKLKHGDIYGKEMSVLLDKEKYANWEILKEQKNILGFRCFKAMTTYKSFDKNEEEIEVEVYAWFTPEIPFSVGPKDIDGLPGLILEASTNKRFIFVASEIELNPDDLSVKKPESKETISTEAYEKMVKKVLKMIKERG